ncbi:MAG: histidinol-phosphate transaminase [Polyangiaceae bacterium]|nr:histidinol-phosphate transaminase [Polyangiaceae bacterium]
MRPLVTPTIESLVPYEAGKPVEELARELGVADAVKLASNENPLGPSPRALDAVRQALPDLHRYPDAATYALREKLAAVHGVAMNEVLPGNGSNELIELFIRTFTTSADHVVFAEPSFVVYKLACLAHGVPFSAVPLRDFTHDLEAMAAKVNDKTRLVFVANPNNPTGTHVGRAAVSRLLRELPPQVIVVMDEAYLQYAEAADYPDCLQLRGERERLVVLRTFSKVYGLAALRVGYAVAPAQLVDYVNRVRAPFNVGTLGQVAALAALEDHEHVERSRRLNAEQRRRLEVELGRLPLTVVPSQANFVFVDARRPGRELYEALLRKGVIVRPLGDSTFLRITVGSAAQNDRLLTALAEVLS